MSNGEKFFEQVEQLKTNIIKKNKDLLIEGDKYSYTMNCNRLRGINNIIEILEDIVFEHGTIVINKDLIQNGKKNKERKTIKSYNI